MPKQQPAVKVTFTVTVEMTPEQRDGYAAEYGVGFVALDARGRVRGEVAEALQAVPWLREFTTVEISEPKVKERG